VSIASALSVLKSLSFGFSSMWELYESNFTCMYIGVTWKLYGVTYGLFYQHVGVTSNL
jgi:hypothetical protein